MSADWVVEHLDVAVARIFGIKADEIAAVSAAEGYGLPALVNKIVNTLPNEKKFGVVREAKKENVTKESEREAERGFWESIKNFAIKAYKFYKENQKIIHAAFPAIWAIFSKRK